MTGTEPESDRPATESAWGEPVARTDAEPGASADPGRATPSTDLVASMGSAGTRRSNASGSAPRRPMTATNSATGLSATATRPRPQRQMLRERQAPAPRVMPVLITRRDRRRVRIVERFTGKRVRNQVGIWRRVRSLVLLLVLAAILAAVVTAILAAVVAGLSLAFQHASGS